MVARVPRVLLIVQPVLDTELLEVVRGLVMGRVGRVRRRLGFVLNLTVAAVEEVVATGMTQVGRRLRGGYVRLRRGAKMELDSDGEVDLIK